MFYLFSPMFMLCLISYLCKYCAIILSTYFVYFLYRWTVILSTSLSNLLSTCFVNFSYSLFCFPQSSFAVYIFSIIHMIEDLASQNRSSNFFIYHTIFHQIFSDLTQSSTNFFFSDLTQSSIKFSNPISCTFQHS